MFGLLQNFGKLGASGGTSNLIAQLFAGGTNGFAAGLSVTEAYQKGWLFQDSAGTTAAALELPIGKVLDVSGSNNHATQSTSTKRPTLSARVNLLTATADYANATYWPNSVSWSVTKNDIQGPNRMASKIATVSGGPFNSIPYTAPSASLVFKFIARDGTRSPYPIIYNYTLDAFTTYTVATLALGGGWLQYTLTTTGGVYVGNQIGFYLAGSSFPDGTYFWVEQDSADVRPTDTPASLPAYQRVNTATDYDTAGFPLYLSFDGTDDCLVTPSIDLSYTDKATVFAGVRKLSDVAQGTIIAFGDVGSNAGSTEIGTTGGGTAAYSAQMKNSDLSVWSSPSSFAAPISNVLTVSEDFSLTTNSGRNKVSMSINGVDESLSWSTGNAGTGNFGNLPVNICARNGTSLLFNGHIYTIPILVGGAVSASLKAQVQAAINRAMGGVY